MSSIHIIKGNFKEKMELPIAEGLKAGFPSPAEDYNHETLDFNRDLIRNPEATFYGKVEGDSMVEAGINDGDIAVIDRSVEPQDGDVVVGYRKLKDAAVAAVASLANTPNLKYCDKSDIDDVNAYLDTVPAGERSTAIAELRECAAAEYSIKMESWLDNVIKKIESNSLGGQGITLLGLTDGCDAKTGNGYLDIVDFILQNCCDVEQNLRQLYRRVAFNIAIGNSDDHFRNHGFLLTPRGWTLSPAYDMNPTLNEYQALLINSTTNHADLQVLLDSSEEYMIGKEEAVRIIEEVKAGVKHWKSIATRLGIAKREMDVFEQVFQRSLK